MIAQDRQRVGSKRMFASHQTVRAPFRIHRSDGVNLW